VIRWLCSSCSILINLGFFSPILWRFIGSFFFIPRHRLNSHFKTRELGRSAPEEGTNSPFLVSCPFFSIGWYSFLFFFPNHSPFPHRDFQEIEFSLPPECLFLGRVLKALSPPGMFSGLLLIENGSDERLPLSYGFIPLFFRCSSDANLNPFLSMPMRNTSFKGPPPYKRLSRLLFSFFGSLPLFFPLGTEVLSA